MACWFALVGAGLLQTATLELLDFGFVVIWVFLGLVDLWCMFVGFAYLCLVMIGLFGLV